MVRPRRFIVDPTAGHMRGQRGGDEAEVDAPVGVVQAAPVLFRIASRDPGVDETVDVVQAAVPGRQGADRPSLGAGPYDRD